LAKVGENASSAFDRVAELAGDPEANVRQAVVKSVRDISSNADRILPLLIKSLEDEEWEVRRHAAQELGDMGEDASPAVPALLEMLRADDDSDAARQALREINTAGDEAVPILLEIVQDEKAGQRSRYYSMYLLRQMGPRARAALPVLQELHDKSDGRRREYLQRAIREIKGEKE
jgi:HEAT repeat protein